MPSKENFVFPSPLRSAFITFVLSKTPKTMSEEYVDLFDSDDRPLSRSVPKRQAHQQGLWHRSAHVWIYDRTGNILMQKRAQTKDTFPGLWDISVAGHISAGETPTEGALRELKEEIGLEVQPDQLELLTVIHMAYPYPLLAGSTANTATSICWRAMPTRTLLPCSAKRWKPCVSSPPRSSPTSPWANGAWPCRTRTTTGRSWMQLLKKPKAFKQSGC